MSATTVEPAGPSTIDISGTPGIPMTRLVSVELRKLTDTRAGKWLLIAIAVVIALVMLIFWLNASASDRKFALTQVTSVLLGLAFGLLFLNSAAAIVVYFVLPIAFTIVANLWGALNKAAPWIDLNTAQTPLQNSAHVTGHEWLQIACATVIWVVLPFLLGLVRVLRAEVK